MQTTNYKGFVVTLSDEDTKKLDKAYKGASKHWRCIVYDKPNRKQMGFDVFGGSMTTMSPLKALYIFCSTALYYVNDELFVDKKAYKQIENAYFKCRKFLGSEDDISEIINELIEKKWV